MYIDDLDNTLQLCKIVKEQINNIFTHGVISLTKNQDKELSDISKKFNELGLLQTAQTLEKFLKSTHKTEKVKSLFKLYTILRLLEHNISIRFAMATIKEE